MGGDRPTATTVHGVVVSGGLLAGTALGRDQVRKRTPKAPTAAAVVTNRAGATGPAGGRLRQLTPDRGESENRKQGTHQRGLTGRPPQRSSLLLPICSDSICTRRVQPAGPHCVTKWPIRRTSRPAKKFPWKLSPAVNVAVGTTAVVSATRWAKGSPAHGAPG